MVLYLAQRSSVILASSFRRVTPLCFTNISSASTASTASTISQLNSTPTTFASFNTLSLQKASKNNRPNLFSTMAAEDIAEECDAKDEEIPLALTEDERYLFDLNGFLIVRNVLTDDEVRRANEAIDKHQEAMKHRDDATLRNAVPNTSFYGTGPPRKDLGGVLEWGDDSLVFKSILAHPKLVPRFHGLLGKGYRMDHMPFVIACEKGGEGFQLHGGTVDCGTGEYNHHLAYTCHHGTIRSALMGCSVILTDHYKGAGGFCVVPGSHKSNFKMPNGMMDGERYKEYIIQPETKAGDVILFSEGTVHGAMAWEADYQRRLCLYRFSPATNCYGRSYFSADAVEGTRWPEKLYDDMTDAQKAVLEPPYANRLDRPNINEDGSIVITTRNTRKKTHDKEVFGTKYF